MLQRSEATRTGSSSSRYLRCGSLLSELCSPNRQLKDTRAANATPGTPTLLHYLVRVILRSDPALLNFLDEASHVAAASRSTSPLGLAQS